MAAAKPSRSVGSTKVVVMPKRGRVFCIRLTLPPYICDEATMWSPCSRMAVMPQNVAAMPEAVHTAAEPPSSAAMRCSSTPTVGLVIRE